MVNDKYATRKHFGYTSYHSKHNIPSLPPCHPSIHTFSRARGRDGVKCVNTQVDIYVLYKKFGFPHARVSRPGGEQERFAPFLPCMDSISHNGTGNQPPGCGKARGGTD